MASDGEIIYTARVDGDDVEKDLDKIEKKVEKSTKDTGQKTEKIERETGDTTKKVNDDVTDHHKQQNDERVKDDEKTGHEREEQEKKTGERLKSIAGTTVKAIGAGLLAAGTGAIAVGTMAVNTAVSMDQAMNQFIASTGKGTEETERYQTILEGIYKNNYGDSFDDIADAMAQIHQQIGPVVDSWDDTAIQAFTESAYALRDTFGYDIQESVRAASTMMEQFGMDGEDAMSLIAAGAQNGLDFSGELIDSINEYSVQFAKLGMDADDMFKIFQEGADSGAFNLDKVGDAVKELSIRVIDGSETTEKGFAKLGLNADTMAAKFAAGGDTAKEAFQETIKALADMEDPIEQNAAGVALFGTMWEDLGADAVTALVEIEDGAYDTGEAMEGLKKVKYDDLGSMFEGLKRSVELLLLPLGEQLIPILSELIQTVMPIIEDVLPQLTDAAGQLITAIAPMIEEILPVIMDLINQLLPPLMEIIEAILPVIINLFSELLPPVTQLISAVLPVLLDLINALLPIFTTVIDLLGPLIGLFTNLITPIIELIASAITPLIEIISALIADAIEPLSDVIEALSEVFGTVFADIFNSVSGVVKSIMGIFKGIIDFIKNVFTGNWRGAWQAVKDIFKSIISGIGSIFKAPINWIIDGINKFIGGLNKIKIPDWVPLVGGKGFHINPIPRLKVGMDYVPSDDFPALLHRGETVLTAEDAQRLRRFGGVDGVEAALSRGVGLAATPAADNNLDPERIYAAVKNGAEAARLQANISAKAVGHAVTPTVNQDLGTTATQGGRYNA